jgi:hypothetical protein
MFYPRTFHAFGDRNIALGQCGEVQRIGYRLVNRHVAKCGGDSHYINMAVG